MQLELIVAATGASGSSLTLALIQALTKERDSLREGMREIRDMKVGEAEDVKYVQASQWYKMKAIARAYLGEEK